MKLTQLTEHIWITDHEQRRDRPKLGYIHTNERTIAIDAGHSKEHVQEFYDLLAQENLPLPELTLITHWHWDHTFGMHAVHGLTCVEKNTEQELQRVLQDWDETSSQQYKDMNEHIRAEYENRTITVKGADVVFDNELNIHLGEVSVHAFHVPSSHTEDSTIMLIPEEKVIFIGDCICGKSPDWIVDYPVRNQLIELLKTLDFNIAVGSHWEPFTKEELITALVNDTI